jgi:ComF family protein
MGDSISQTGRWRAVVRVLRSPAALARQILDDVVITVVPATCRVCEGPLERAGAVPVCTTCVGHVTAEVPIGCWRCGEAIDLDLDMEDIRFASLLGETLLCRECRMSPPAFERAVSFGTYSGEMRALIGLLKFSGIRGVARVLGGHLAESIAQLEPVAGPELLVVAVPLFSARERRRGFNQSVLLADEALRRLKQTRPGWKLTAAHGRLARRKSTDSSLGLTRRGRRRNMSGAFEVKGSVRGQEVLLVDDVLTTGATARECARVLLRAGATRVWVATLARSQKGAVRRFHQGSQEETAAWDLAMP